MPMVRVMNDEDVRELSAVGPGMLISYLDRVWLTLDAESGSSNFAIADISSGHVYWPEAAEKVLVLPSGIEVVLTQTEAICRPVPCITSMLSEDD